MLIHAEHHVEAGEQDEGGFYDYYYAYTDFVLETHDMKAGFRIYDNERSVWAVWIEDEGILKRVKWQPSRGSATIMAPYSSTSFRRMLAYFRDQHSIKTVSAWSDEANPRSEKLIGSLI